MRDIIRQKLGKGTDTEIVIRSNSYIYMCGMCEDNTGEGKEI